MHNVSQKINPRKSAISIVVRLQRMTNIYSSVCMPCYRRFMMSTTVQSSDFPRPALQLALASSLDDGVFADTAYSLYSRRLSNWKIGKPATIYANSLVMKDAGQYFAAREFGGVDAHDHSAYSCFYVRT